MSRTTPINAPIITCPRCGLDHPTGKRHCGTCGKPSAFIQDDGLCLKCRAGDKR